MCGIAVCGILCGMKAIIIGAGFTGVQLAKTLIDLADIRPGTVSTEDTVSTVKITGSKSKERYGKHTLKVAKKKDKNSTVSLIKVGFLKK